MKPSSAVLGIAILFLIVAGWLWWGMRGRSEQHDGMRVGVILPLSGEFSLIGEEMKRGVELAQKEAEKRGLRVQVIYEDDMSFNSSVIVSAARKLLHQDTVDVILTGFVESTKPIIPLTQPARVPVIVMWDSNKYLQESGPYVFGTGISTELAGEKMALYAYQERGLRSVAVVSQFDPWSEIISEAFQSTFEALGGKIVLDERLAVSERDFRSVITKIQAAQVDGIYLALVFAPNADFLIQAKRAGVQSVLLGTDSFTQDVIDVARGAAEGVEFTYVFTEESVVQKLTPLYQEHYRRDPIDINLVAFGYEAFEALEQAIRSDAQDVRQGLVQVIGENRVRNKAEKLFRVVDGKMQLLE